MSGCEPSVELPAGPAYGAGAGAGADSIDKLHKLLHELLLLRRAPLLTVGPGATHARTLAPGTKRMVSIQPRSQPLERVQANVSSAPCLGPGGSERKKEKKKARTNERRS